MHPIVVKFGGTSVANYSAMLNCCHIMAQQTERRIMVVSAPAGITNALVSLAYQADNDTRQQILSDIQVTVESILTDCLSQQLQLIDELARETHQLVSELVQFVINANAAMSEAQIDRLLSFGERLSSLFCSYIFNHHYGDTLGYRAINFDVRKVMITDNRFGQANPLCEAIAAQVRQQLSPLLASKCVITQGFIGSTQDGSTTTLGRGGSDYTAALLSEAINAQRCEIWTDVAGVYSTDPRLDPTAVPLLELSYDEAAEMANFGAKVLHPATLAPTLRCNIPVFVGSSREPQYGGTLIVKDCQHEPSIRAITRRCDQELVTIHTPQMKGASGFLRQVFAVLDEHDISVDLITTSEVAVALTFDKPLHTSVNQEKNAQAINQLKEIAHVDIDKQLDLVTVVGNHLQSTPGVTANIFAVLSDYRIRMVCYGANPHNLSFLVDEKHSGEIVRTLHKALIHVPG